MPPQNLDVLPFLTRKMLAFEHGTTVALRITVQSVSTAALTVRGVTREGVFNFNFTPTSNSVISQETFNIPDIPIFLSVTDRDGSLIQGETYASLHLLINGDIVHELCAGLVYRQKALSWPSSNNLDQRPGGGHIARVAGTDPAVNTEASITVTTGQIWKIQSARVTLVTDANAANRRLNLLIDDGTNPLIETWSSDDQAANTTRQYSISTAISTHNTVLGNDIWVPLPQDLVLMAGSRLLTQTSNMQAGDNWSEISCLIERWFTPI